MKSINILLLFQAGGSSNFGYFMRVFTVFLVTKALQDLNHIQCILMSIDVFQFEIPQQMITLKMAGKRMSNVHVVFTRMFEVSIFVFSNLQSSKS